MATPLAESKLLLDVNEAATVLSMGRTAIYEEIRTGRLRSIKRGRSRLIPMKSIHEFVESLMSEEGAVA